MLAKKQTSLITMRADKNLDEGQKQTDQTNRVSKAKQSKMANTNTCSVMAIQFVGFELCAPRKAS